MKYSKFMLACLMLTLFSCGSRKIPLLDSYSTNSFLYLYTTETLPAIEVVEDESILGILKQYKTQEFFQSWPNAQHDTLDRIYEIHFQDGRVPNSFVKKLTSLPLIEKIEIAEYYIAEGHAKPVLATPDASSNIATVTTCSNPFPPVNDPYVVNNWVNNDAQDLLAANCAWGITTGKPTIVVGIADTEFDETHEDLVNQIISTWGTTPPNCVHGTLVAGCVSAETNNNKGIAGIGYNTSIAGYKVVHTGCYGNPWPAVWQASQDGVDVINVSWTGIGSPPGGVTLAAQQIVDNGTVLVVAAGNSPGSTSHQGYATIPGVINVSGVDANNNHGPTGHAHNAWVDVCALSTNVTTTYPGNNYGGGWGTSFAAPQVAGVAALVLAANPCLSPPEVEAIIKSTTDPIDDANLFPFGLGTGRVNAYKAVEKAATLCIENINIQNDQDYESHIICTRDIILSNNAELELIAVKKVEIFDSFIIQPGTKLEIYVDANHQIDCN